MKEKKETESEMIVLSDEDHSTAKKLSQEFEIDIEKIEEVFLEIRNIINGNKKDIYKDEYFDFQTTGFIRKTIESIGKKKSDIRCITIVTTKGDIKIKCNSIFFRHFETSLKYLKSHCKSVLKDRENCPPDKFLQQEAYEATLYEIYFWNYGKFSKYVIAGLILLYFNIDPRCTLLTKQQFENSNELQAPNYNAYLYDIMKSRFKSLEIFYSRYKSQLTENQNGQK